MPSTVSSTCTPPSVSVSTALPVSLDPLLASSGTSMVLGVAGAGAAAAAAGAGAASAPGAGVGSTAGGFASGAAGGSAGWLAQAAIAIPKTKLLESVIQVFMRSPDYTS